eukprot:14017852-Alexandrium_andersonii.AAC.1
MDTARLPLFAKMTASKGPASMVGPPAKRAKPRAKCAIGWCIAPAPAARFRPAAASSPSAA